MLKKFNLKHRLRMIKKSNLKSNSSSRTMGKNLNNQTMLDYILTLNNLGSFVCGWNPFFLQAETSSMPALVSLKMPVLESKK